jgi:uncharacterized protein
MNIVEEIRKFVKEECEKPTSKYGFEPFENHFEPMVKWAEKLADKLGGDKEVILIASWLHDIGSIIEGRKDHHLTGAKIARKKLVELDYPEEKIKLVEKCILHHRGSRDDERKTLEEKIVAEADIVSNFDNIVGIVKTALVYENKTEKEAKQEVLDKLERKWKQIHFEESRNLIKPRLEAVRLLFGGND